MCRILSGDSKAELTKALNAVERNGKVKIHHALKTGFSNYMVGQAMLKVFVMG